MTLTGYIVGTKGNTGRGIASIVENADYTITINLTDGSSYTTAPIAGFTAVDFDENYDLVVTKTDGTTETVETDIEAFREVLEGYKDDAETAATNANTYQGWAQDYASNAQAQAGYASTYKQAAYDSQVAAGTSESNAGTQALKSEGYAVGKQNGTDVSSGSDYYHNNAKYYSDMAHIDATDASDSQSSASGSASTASAQALKSEGYAVGKQNGTDVTSGSDYYQNNSKYYKEQAASSATGASGSASSASASALVAEGWAKGTQNGTAVESGTYFEDNAKYYAEEAASSASDAAASAASLTVDSALSGSSTNPVQNKVIKGELDTKANVDGYYESLGSGTADQLASNIYEEDNTPYNFRTSGGSIDIGGRETDMLVGGTVAWNQLVPISGIDNTVTVKGVTFTNNGDGSVTINGTATSDISGNDFRAISALPVISGHKYLYKGCPSGGSSSTYFVYDGYSFRDFGNGSIGTPSLLRCVIYIKSGTTLTNAMFVPQIFDLTAMFGTTIADYIYSLETANAGAGVAWFKKLFPKPYYAYNAGELMSVQASSHDMVGFNAFDVSEYTDLFTNYEYIDSAYRCRSIKLVPNQTYCVSTNGDNDSSIVILVNKFSHVNETGFADLRNGSERKLITTGDDGLLYIGVHDTVGSPTADIVAKRLTEVNLTINLSWDGERDGEYEAYVKHSYPLDSSLTLRGIPKLDASNNLYYDGDVYESDGSVTRKYGIVDLGTLNWAYVSDTTYPRFTAQLSGIKNGVTSVVSNIVCSKYKATYTNDIYDNGTDKSIGVNSTYLWVRDTSYTDAATFKTAMSGVYLVYELDSPTTESADPFQSPQIVDDFGTEEYVDYPYSQGNRDVAIPVGHETQYMANLKAKLEMSPNSPEGAGDYIVRQTNGENEYVTLASNATIQDIIARLEALEGGE